MLQKRGGKRMGVLDGKVALVTGASKGIGAGIAKGLAAAGASVVVNYASSKEGADRVVSEIAERGGKAIAAQSLVLRTSLQFVADVFTHVMVALYN
jgi:3-oxoacyl-[acyl-carrier protein] reductase